MEKPKLKSEIKKGKLLKRLGEALAVGATSFALAQTDPVLAKHTPSTQLENVDKGSKLFFEQQKELAKLEEFLDWQNKIQSFVKEVNTLLEYLVENQDKYMDSDEAKNKYQQKIHRLAALQASLHIHCEQAEFFINPKYFQSLFLIFNTKPEVLKEVQQILEDFESQLPDLLVFRDKFDTIMKKYFFVPNKFLAPDKKGKAIV